MSSRFNSVPKDVRLQASLSAFLSFLFSFYLFFLLPLRSTQFRFFTCAISRSRVMPTTRLLQAAERCIRRLFATVSTAYRYAELLARLYTFRFNFHGGVSWTTCERDVADGLLVFTACLNRSPATPRPRRGHPEARLRAFRLQNITIPHPLLCREKTYVNQCTLFDDHL